jgi:hypothetical protein
VKVLAFFIFFFFTAGSAMRAHPVHVSVCNIELTKNESIIAVKLFSDDFGTVLQNKYNQDFVLSKADEKPYRDYIINYVGSNLKITFNRNKSLMFEYDYSEVNEGAIWIYFKADRLNSTEKMKVVNTLMLDLYEDQTNLLIINHEGKQDGFRFNNQVRELEIDLK